MHSVILSIILVELFYLAQRHAYKRGNGLIIFCDTPGYLKYIVQELVCSKSWDPLLFALLTHLLNITFNQTIIWFKMKINVYIRLVPGSILYLYYYFSFLPTSNFCISCTPLSLMKKILEHHELYKNNHCIISLHTEKHSFVFAPMSIRLSFIIELNT